MKLVTVDASDSTPLRAQLERGLRAAIAIGRLRPGDQLPTVRQLAVTVRVNANTVSRVYSDLERSGILETKRGVGTFVRGSAEQALPTKERERRLRGFAIKLLSDAVSAGFGIEEVTEAVEALISEGARSLSDAK